jgi:hypothetical protein
MTNETLTLGQLAALTSQREAKLRVLAASTFLQHLSLIRTEIPKSSATSRTNETLWRLTAR